MHNPFVSYINVAKNLHYISMLIVKIKALRI